jgi:hypothetical protein
MKHIKNSLEAFFSLFVIVAGLTLFIPTLIQGQKSEAAIPTADVRVVNTASEPVPVAGTVNVGNLGNDPLPVRDVDRSTRLPVHFNDSYTVPDGKRLVIEYVSLNVAATFQCELVTAAVSSEGVVLHLFNPTFVGTSTIGPTTSYRFGLSQETRAYIGQNRTVNLGLYTYFGCGNVNVYHAAATGYLVDLE